MIIYGAQPEYLDKLLLSELLESILKGPYN